MGFAHELRNEMLSALDDKMLSEGVHLVDANGRIHTGPDAVMAIAPLPKIVRPLVTSGYEWVAGHRADLARFVPDVRPVERLR